MKLPINVVVYNIIAFYFWNPDQACLPAGRPGMTNEIGWLIDLTLALSFVRRGKLNPPNPLCQRGQ
jgi:hypothetical protein